MKQIMEELIKEMELRVFEFKRNRDLFGEHTPIHHYWDGKCSEAEYVVEKLKMILFDI